MSERRTFELVGVDPAPSRVCAFRTCEEVSVWHVCLRLRARSSRLPSALPDPIDRLAGKEPSPIRVVTAFGVCEEHRLALVANPLSTFSREEWQVLQAQLARQGRTFDPSLSTIDPTPISAGDA